MIHPDMTDGRDREGYVPSLAAQSLFKNRPNGGLSRRSEVKVKKERAAPVAPSAAQIKQFNDERYESKSEGNQAPADDINEFLDQLRILADWLDSLLLRIDRRQHYLECMNGFARYDDLKMEVKDFNTACRGLIAAFGKKRRAA